MIDYKLIGSRIKTERQRAGLTQEIVSEKVNMTTVYLSKIENGHVKPTIELLNAICETIGIDLGMLFQASSTVSPAYQNEQIVQLFNACSPDVKPIALELLRNLSKIK